MDSIVFIAGVLASLLGNYDADMRLDPKEGWPQLHEVFAVTVLVEADTPVNVFRGEIEFNADYLEVESINYNNSVADLWVVEPWHSNGEGTINFAGGSTKSGGFIGEDTLLEISFKTKQVGNARVTFDSVEILKYDGLGTSANVAESLDAVFAISDELNEKVVTDKRGNKAKLYVMPDTFPTDLNGDGKQSIADLSMFMSDLSGKNPRSDFNGDGSVSLADLSILLDRK